ncbi:divergent PAP2 family protein [Candidatus Falkowbacteria bacterium]|nr:divergent PAP2 family protein [Candidatus Falkowbacteria bacterium]
MPYHFFLVPLVAAFVAQLIKVALHAAKGQFTWRDLNSYGGMPSSHSALVTSLAAIIGYFEGWDSAMFAVAVVLMILIIRDSGGFRRVLGNHSQALNQLVQNLKSDAASAFSHQTERLGHTPLELFFGALIGLVVVALYVLIFV